MICGPSHAISAAQSPSVSAAGCKIWLCQDHSGNPACAKRLRSKAQARVQAPGISRSTKW